MNSAFAVDTSCIVPAVAEWHTHHQAAMKEIERRLRRGERMVVPAHALAESYAVLTRLPAPMRLAAADAWATLEATFVAGHKVIALDADAYVALLRDFAGDGVEGGNTYDGLIAACAISAKAAVLLTFNVRHFHPAPAGLAVVEPCGT